MRLDISDSDISDFEMYIYRWMWGLIGRWSGDRNIASAEGNGLGPLHMCDCDIVIKRRCDEFAIRHVFLQYNMDLR